MILVVLVHALIFIVFWLTNQPYQSTLNNFLIGATGINLNFMLVFMVFAGLIALWAVLWLIRRKKGKTAVSGVLIRSGIFFLVFFYGSFIFLFLKNPAQLFRVGQGIQYFRLILDSAILFTFTRAASRWVHTRKLFSRLLVMAGIAAIWLVPVILPPGNVYAEKVPEKPRIFGHRGAANQAPENTMASMEAAADLGVYGLETDINVSKDGVLFLMHDATLKRTTNVAEVFPERKNDLAESYTWEEISRLDAGGWFSGSTYYDREPVPQLKTLLDFISKKDLLLIYDLRFPESGHPFAEETLPLVLREIQAAGITDATWILAKPEEREEITAMLPGAILAYGIGYTDEPPAPEFLVENGYQVVNSVYSLSRQRIRVYQEAGLWVNLWVVDEPWQYSRLWLAGADSVTTNDIANLKGLTRPLLSIPLTAYLLVWISLGILALGWFWWATRRSMGQ